MGYYRKLGHAKRNISQSKGFVCPTCDSLVPRGYEICYNCGDDPIISSSSGYYNSSEGNFALVIFILFWLIFITPILYLISSIGEPSENVFNFFLLLPNLVILYYNTLVFLKKKERRKLGCIALPVRLWILTFSFLTFINTMDFFITFFILKP